MSRPLRGNLGASHTNSGFVLIEVMVGVLLMAALLGPLADCVQRSVAAVDRVRRAAAAATTAGIDDPALAAWTWGPSIAQASWANGPELSLRNGSQSGTVGLWRAGWLVGEWAVSGGEVVRITANVWADQVGQEVVIRVRAGHSGWGPPWRSIVPGSYGGGQYQETVSWAPADAQSDYESVFVAAHVRSSGSYLPVPSWSTVAADLPGRGLLLLPCAAPDGVCGLEVGGRVQTWMSHEGRRLDVYF